MNREIPYEPDLVCEECGKRGAFDFMGDALCSKCAFPSQPTVRSSLTKVGVEDKP